MQPGYAYPGYPPPGYPPAAPQGWPQQPPAAPPAPPQGFGSMPPALTAPSEPPPQGDRLKAGETEGHLLIVCPIALHPNFFPAKDPSKDKPQDAIEIDIVDLDQQENGGWGKVYHRVMWGGVLIAPALAQQIGATVLARMGKGVAKGSNNAPYKLLDATTDPQCVARAQEFFGRRPGWRAEEPASPPSPPPGQAPYQWPAGSTPAQAAPYGPPPGQPHPGQGQPPAGPYGQPQQPYGGPPAYAPAPQGPPPGYPPTQPYQQGPPPGYQNGAPPSAEAQALYAGQFPTQP